MIRRLFNVPLLTGSLFATAGCLMAASSAIALEVNFNTVQERSGETVEIEHNVVQNFRALQQEILEEQSATETGLITEEASSAGALTEPAASDEAESSDGFVEANDN